ncbi:hypothetical protein BH09MYX1_BH09MYX1_35320 [soil metagenome]
MSKLGDWLDERLDHRRRIDAALAHPLAGGPSWAAAMAWTLGMLLFVLVVTGFALQTTYVAGETTAWASVYYTQNVAAHGWLLRGIHHFSGEAMLVLAALHVATLAIQGTARRPRELAVFASLALIAVIAAACITGEALPWDQQGFWARKVELAVAGGMPGGSFLARLVTGDGSLGPLALTRFHALHVILLPLAMALLLRLRSRAETTYARAALARKSVTVAYFPRQAARDMALALSVMLAVSWITYRAHGAPLDGPAEPRSDFPARPEWYLLWLFELRHHLKGALELPGTALTPIVIGVGFAALPLLSRKTLGPSRAGVALVVLSAGLIGGMTFVALRRDARDEKFHVAVAKSDLRTIAAKRVAAAGVPPDGPLAMLARDPELRGEALFEKHCATCHVLGDLGDAKKPAAPTLDGFGTATWILATLHDPDAIDRFGNTPYLGEMPSQDVPPKEDAERFRPLSKDEANAVAAFLVAQGDDEQLEQTDAATLSVGEKIVSERCTSCHLLHGTGDDGGEGLAPELAGYGSLVWVRAQIDNPSSKATYRENALDPTRKGHMPAFELIDGLTAADRDILARWTRARGRGLPFK